MLPSKNQNSAQILTFYLTYLLTYLLTYSTVHSRSWEANWFAASQVIPCISRNPKVHYRTHKRPPPVSILGKTVFIPCMLHDVSPRNTPPPRDPSCGVVYLRIVLSPEQASHMWVFLNKVFYREGLLAPRPIPNLEGHPSSAVRDYLFSLFAATLLIGGLSSIRSLRTRHAAVTRTHVSPSVTCSRAHFINVLPLGQGIRFHTLKIKRNLNLVSFVIFLEIKR